MPVNADNVLGFGSDDDSLYLGAYDPDLGTKITGLTTAIPHGNSALLYPTEARLDFRKVFESQVRNNRVRMR